MTENTPTADESAWYTDNDGRAYGLGRPSSPPADDVREALETLLEKFISGTWSLDVANRILAAFEVRPYGTVTEPSDSEVDRAAQAIYEDLGGEWAWTSLTSSFRESYLSNARAALKAAREARR